jgi:hypothetical protein
MAATYDSIHYANVLISHLLNHPEHICILCTLTGNMLNIKPFMDSVLVCLCCPIMCLYVLSLPPVVCRRAHVLFTLFVFVCVKWYSTHIDLCFSFVFLRFVYHTLPVSLDCPFLIAPSVFSNVYLSVSLDCPFLIAPSVFSNVYL